ncbi:MAG: branched-chain amino acid ABC transporter permease [Chloroflexota bacterium]|nr:branched-chain amino acid ABC transporter permease [Chloroflexota bacterium]
MPFVLPILNGISQGVLLFLVASGLSLVFGVMGLLNFAHGGFFALGAFVAYSLTAGASLPAWQFLVVVVAGALIVGLIGVAAEVLVFRRIYHLPPIDALLATYAVLLTVQGGITQVWGVNPVGVARSPEFRGAVPVAGVDVPAYDFALIAIGAVVVVALWWLLERSSFGRVVRATAADRTMSACLGINVRFVFAAMFGLGSFLAALGGGLVSQLVQVDAGLAATFVIQSFAVVVVGGLGSIFGALVAALLLGLLDSLVVSIDPTFSGFSLYLGMTLILLARPSGLFGSASDRL